MATIGVGVLVESTIPSLAATKWRNSVASSLHDRRVRVSIVNRLGNGRTMNIHCQSRDDDLGYLRIPDGYETEWSFNVNIWGTTLFYCDVQWGDSEWLHFDAYSYKSDSGRCDTVCRWMVAEDGLLYVYNQENEKWEHMPFQDML
ncbi:unnamed protein product [Ilex paraguariensis]|uniref:S-protein homolog n=1 Tax=Ilex paraguariensis TaxID=185542 RepID=A0ABC8RGG5_9AQUA